MRYLDGAPAVVRETFAAWQWKAIWAAMASASAWIFPTEAAGSIAIGAGALMTLDMATGWKAAHLRGESTTSQAFSRTLTKALGYFAIIIVADVVGMIIQSLSGAQSAMNVVVTAAVTFIALTEAISVLENTSKMGVAGPTWLVAVAKRLLKENDDIREENIGQ
jgi:phage-related holin